MRSVKGRVLRRARFAAAFLAIQVSVGAGAVPLAASDPLADRLDEALAAGALRGGRIATLVVLIGLGTSDVLFWRMSHGHLMMGLSAW